MFTLADVRVLGMRSGELLILLIILFGLLYRYLIYRMRHKQIMTAIEKGLPLSELKINKRRSPQWITNITFGIALLLISPCIIIFTCLFLLDWREPMFLQDQPFGVYIFFGATIFCIGIALLIRGLLQRKAEKSKAEIRNVSAEPK